MTKIPTSPKKSLRHDVRIIKKYPNRRLYDTTASSYVTLADIKAMVIASEPCMVIDSKTDIDLTRAILLQIILEEEVNGTPIFSAPVLANIVKFYGHAMQGIIGGYLERTFQSILDIQNHTSGNTVFTQFQEQIQKQTIDFQEKSKNFQEKMAQQFEQFFDLMKGKE
jgi:polyhydroxyalkanoate synthesis repressor PhaR